MTTYNFTNSSIRSACGAVEEKLTALGIEHKLILRTVLAAESVLLNYSERFGEDKTFTLEINKRFGVVNTVLSVAGESVDPFSDKSEEDVLLARILPTLGATPAWAYRHGRNTVTFPLRRKPKIPFIVYILAGTVLGIALGLLFSALLPEQASAFGETYLEPVSSAITGLLGTLAAFLIFFSIVSGVCSIGDLSEFSKIGKKMLLRFFIILVIVALLLCAGVVLSGVVQSGGGEGFRFDALWKMIVDIVPINVLGAFMNGNALQIVFLAFFTAVILLSLSSAHPQLIALVSEASTLLQNMLQIVIKGMPVVAFISLFNLTLSGKLSSFLEMYKFLLCHFAVCLVIVVFFVLRVVLTRRVRLSVLVKKLFPTFFIAFSTSSSLSAFTSNLETCEKKLGVDRRLTGISVPLSQSLFKPPVVAEYFLETLFIACSFGVPINFSFIITLLISALIFSFATPPLPGATPSCFALIFAQCGVPASAISIVIALDAIADRITTASMIVCQQTELVQFAHSMDMLDAETLKKP